MHPKLERGKISPRLLKFFHTNCISLTHYEVGTMVACKIASKVGGGAAFAGALAMGSTAGTATAIGFGAAAVISTPAVYILLRHYPSLFKAMKYKIDEAMPALQNKALRKETLKDFREISDEDLKNLSTKEKYILLRSSLTARDEAALRYKFYYAVGVDKELDNHFQQNLNDFTTALKNDNSLKSAAQNWGNLSQDERLVAMKQASDIFAEKLNFPKPDVKSSKLPTKTYFGNSHIRTGKYNNKKNTINLNINKDSKQWDSFETAIEATIKEASHAFQAHLIAEHKSGKIDENSPIDSSIRILSLNQSLYAKPDLVGGSFSTHQPVETHARHWGELAKKVFSLQKTATATPPKP